MNDKLTLLDNPLWHALNTEHAGFAIGSKLARRYPADVTPLAGLASQSNDAYSALAVILGQDTGALFMDAEPEIPNGWTIIHHSEIAQMVCRKRPPALDETGFVFLGIEDAKQMLALTELTKPGPFRQRTHEMGTYIGIKIDGQLVAMAGERTHLTGFTEVSAVCTHPDHLGQGYARKLITYLAREIFERGEIPFLHSRLDNERALKVYEQLGFRMRRNTHLVILNHRASTTEGT